MDKKEKLPFYAFYDSGDDIVEYASSEAKETISALVSSYTFLKNSGDKLLNILLSGSAGAILFLLNNFASSDWSAISTGLLVFSVLWVGLSLYLLFECIQTRERPLGSSSPALLIYNDPDTEKEIEAAKIKRVRLFQMDAEIDGLTKTTKRIAKALDRTRVMASISLIVSVIAAAVHFYM